MEPEKKIKPLVCDQIYNELKALIKTEQEKSILCMLKFVVKNWNTPYRLNALTLVVQEEKRMKELLILMGRKTNFFKRTKKRYTSSGQINTYPPVGGFF